MKLLFIQTGGSIDIDYPRGKTNHGYEFSIESPAVTPILKRANADFEYSILELIKKDSLDLTDQDRELLKTTVEKTSEAKIIITHGTDTINQSAEYLGGIPGKTIVLIGSILPEKFRDSDADFNLGMAIGVVLTAEQGTYVVLGGNLEKIC